MCGISGYIDTLNRDIDLSQSLKSMVHRGPDNTSQKSYIINDFHLGLGHNRLSIIDTSEVANQPMVSNCENFVMIFNGEIYNYKYLSTLLDNFCPKTNSDSEVLLEYFIQYGVKGFHKVNGMFTVVFLDITRNKLFILRDPVGIKPIYLYENDKQLFFSSEIKGLKAYVGELKINNKKIYEFFSLGYLIEPETGFENIKKLMPGSFFEFNLNNGSSFIDLYTDNSKFNSNDNINTNILVDSIKDQLMSDVKVGLFFSGGVDSTVLAAATDLDCVYINNPNESKNNLDKISVDHFKTIRNNSVIEIDSVDDSNAPLDIMKFVAINSEDLVSDYTFYSIFRISKYAKQNNYKVMLSGMGADEIFLGYPRHRFAKYHKQFRFFSFLLRFNSLYNCLEKFFPNKLDRLHAFMKESNFTKAYFNLIGYFSINDLKNLLNPKEFIIGKRSYFNKIDNLSKSLEEYNSLDSKMWELDRLGFLSHNLMVCDKATMINSIEMRVPFLNLRIFNRIHSNLKYMKWNGLGDKNILKKYLSLFNLQYFFKRKKQGFNPDLNKLINSITKKDIEGVLIDNNLLDEVFNKGYISTLIDSHYDGSKNNSYKLWQLVYFHFWYNHNTTV